MKIRHIPIIFVLLIIFAGHCVAAEIMNVRNWTAPDHTRVVIDIDSEPLYDFEENKNLLVLNFKYASLSKSLPAEMVLNTPGITKLVFSQTPEGNVKIEFLLDKYQKTQVFKLKKFQDKPDRVVVDIYQEQISKEEAIKDEAVKAKPKKIIVIDPGHGGDDPGASGKKGTREKNIVLLIGREIKKAINKMPEYRAILTREGDYYVSFNKRLQIAKDSSASLFISVHADAARNRLARGTSIYCLSTGAASNEAAKLLANNENLADIIGGVPNGEGNNESGQIILNMFQTNTINLSKTYAITLMKQLAKVNSLKYKRVQEAPFKVLKLPDIPAVLIETAYISNAGEERLLKNSDFQKKLAAAVALSVSEYLSGTASVGPVNDANQDIDQIKEATHSEVVNEQNEVKANYYRIKRGDTIFSIGRKFNTKVSVLLKLNDITKEDPLFEGRKILVPVNKTDLGNKPQVQSANHKNKISVSRKSVRTYTVKKGDTLFSLAKNNSITVGELCRLNHLKESNPLLSGQKILLP